MVFKSPPSSFSRPLRTSFSKKRLSRDSDADLTPEPYSPLHPLHLDPFADVMPDKGLLTLNFSSHSFLDSTVSTGNIRGEPPLYVVETVGRQTTVLRNDPAGVSLVGIVRWPSKPATAKGKEARAGGISLQMGKGRQRDAEEFLRFGSVLTSRKFNLPHHPDSVKWKKVGKTFHCSTASVKKELAILEPADLGAPPRLRIYELISKNRDPTRPQPEHKGVPLVMLDYLFMTAMILVTEEMEWMNVSQPADLNDDEHYAPSVRDTLRGVHVDRPPESPHLPPSSIHEWRRAISRDSYARPPSPTTSYSSGRSGRSGPNSRSSRGSTDFSPLSSGGRSDPANSRFPPVPPIPEQYQSQPTSPHSEGMSLGPPSSYYPSSIQMVPIESPSPPASSSAVSYRSFNPPSDPRSTSEGSVNGRRSLPRPPDAATAPPLPTPSTNRSDQPWLRQSFAVEKLYGSLPSQPVPAVPSLPEHCPCDECRPAVNAYLWLEQSGRLRGEACPCHQCTARLSHSRSYSERSTSRNTSPLPPPAGPIPPIPQIPTHSHSQQQQQQIAHPQHQQSLASSDLLYEQPQMAYPGGAEYPPPAPVPQKSPLPAKLMAELNRPGVSRASDSEPIVGSSRMGLPSSPPPPQSIYPGTAQYPHTAQSYSFSHFAQQQEQTLMNIPPPPPLPGAHSTSSAPQTAGLAYLAPSTYPAQLQAYTHNVHQAPHTSTGVGASSANAAVDTLATQASNLTLGDLDSQTVVYDMPPPSYEYVQAQLPPQQPPTRSHF